QPLRVAGRAGPAGARVAVGGVGRRVVGGVLSRGGRGRLVQREVLRAAVLGRAGAAASAPARSLGEGQVVEVPAVGVLLDGQRLLAGRQGDAGGDRGPGLVAAGVRDGDRAGQAGAGGVGDVQRVGDAVRRGHPEADRVNPGGGYLDGVVEPLSWCGPAHVVGAAGRAGVLRVGGVLEVDPVGAVAV